MRYTIFFYLFMTIKARLNQPVNQLSILGSWVQAFSSRYVQESYEIDWKCINVHISTDSENHVIIEKEPLIHYLPTNISFKKSYDLQEENLLVPVHQPSIISPSLLLKYENDEYCILTGSDNLSLFIFTKNITEFDENCKTDALNKIKSLNYTTYYKYPIQLYSNKCNNL